jgi:hypothetical protein
VVDGKNQIETISLFFAGLAKLQGNTRATVTCSPRAKGAREKNAPTGHPLHEIRQQTINLAGTKQKFYLLGPKRTKLE